METVSWKHSVRNYVSVLNIGILMIIIKLNGGLGNQMFQFALYQAFIGKGVPVKLDRSKYSHLDEKRACILDYPCFDLHYELCTKREARQYVIGTGMTARVLTKLVGDKKTHIYEKSEYEYDPDVLTLTEGYLDGFWQTWKYMDGIQDTVRKCFTFTCEQSKEVKEYLEKIRQTNSVAVHIRRGDYLKLQNIYGNICTEEYYRNAITKMYQMIENPVFFFFSDDMEWAKQTFTFDKNFVFADGRGVWQDYHDMHLMSECKNMIMANSSFSWWAAFLNDNVDKQIICPARWINHKNTPDVSCTEWIRL